LVSDRLVRQTLPNPWKLIFSFLFEVFNVGIPPPFVIPTFCRGPCDNFFWRGGVCNPIAQYKQHKPQLVPPRKLGNRPHGFIDSFDPSLVYDEYRLRNTDVHSATLTVESPTPPTLELHPSFLPRTSHAVRTLVLLSPSATSPGRS